MTTVEVPCWQVFGWGKGRWTLRSTHYSAEDASEHAEALYHRLHIRTKVKRVTRRMPAVTPPPPPTAASKFRQRQAEQMLELRLATTYYKSGSNGTEIPQPLPKEVTA